MIVVIVAGILGLWLAGNGHPAGWGLVAAAHRGVGYLLHEGGEPVRMRTFYLTDDDLTQLARRAESLRKPATRPVQLPAPVDRDQVEGEGAA